MLRPRMSSSGRGTVVLALGGVQPLMPFCSGASLAPCALAGDRRSPWPEFPPAGRCSPWYGVTTNPQPPS